MDFLTEINNKRAQMTIVYGKLENAKNQLANATSELDKRMLSQLIEQYQAKLQYLEKRIIDLFAIMDDELIKDEK